MGNRPTCDTIGCGRPIPIGREGHPEICPECLKAEKVARKHSHYFKAVPFAAVDVYRVLLLFGVTDPCLQHAIKKLMVAGGRGGGKDIGRDVAEAIDTLNRWVEMRAEDAAAAVGGAR